MNIKQLRKKFKKRIENYQKQLEEWKEKKLEPGSQEEKKFHKLLKEILEFKLPVEILPSYPEFGLWIALKLDAQQTLGF